MVATELSALYKIRFSEQELARKNAIWAVIANKFMQRFIQPTDWVVDVACGYGEFINNIRAARKTAIDLNPDTKNFLKPEVDFLHADGRTLTRLLRDKVDVVFTSNFLEHLPDKKALIDFFDQVWEILNSNGKFIIMGPNLRYAPGQYWDAFDHYLGLTHLTLLEALQLKNFSVPICLDKFLPYTTKTALPTHPWLVWLYLSIPIAWGFLGRQLFIVASKSGGGGNHQYLFAILYNKNDVAFVLFEFNDTAGGVFRLKS
jgi:SAM-dependent methyltransferase